MAGELSDAELGALARHWLLYDLAELGELDEARRRHDELERVAGRAPAAALSALVAGLARRVERARGTLRRGRAAGPRRGAPRRAAPVTPDAQTHFTAQLVAIRREQGRLDELLPEIERFAGGDATAAAWRSILPLAYLDAGDRDRARERLRPSLRRSTAQRRTMLWLTATALAVRGRCELADADGAERLYHELEPLRGPAASQWTFTGNAGSVQRVLGRAAMVAGRRDDACRHFEAALARHIELRAPALLARTRCDFAELLMQGTHGDRRRAHQLLDEAAAAARRLAMSGVAARAGRHRDAL